MDPKKNYYTKFVKNCKSALFHIYHNCQKKILIAASVGKDVWKGELLHSIGGNNLDLLVRLKVCMPLDIATL
jgi:hypothetical protein